jgi:hypothetical protein
VQPAAAAEVLITRSYAHIIRAFACYPFGAMHWWMIHYLLANKTLLAASTLMLADDDNLITILIRI